MPIEIRGIGLLLTEALRAAVNRRLSFALGRYGHRVRRTTVRLVGNADRLFSCRISVEIRHGDDVVIENRDPDMYIAINRAASRLSRAVSRSIDRARLTG